MNKERTTAASPTVPLEKTPAAGSKNGRQVLLLTTSALILAYDAMAATAQGLMTPDQHHPQQTTPGQGGSMGQGGMMGGGMMGGDMMMGPSIMMRMIFALMDADVDLMKLLKLDSGLGARKQLARELGYTGALDGSAEMNVWLHKQVMTKLAESGGKVPDSLKA
jgi:hypothetical protein